MTKNEFGTWLYCGSGRAILGLRAEENKEPFEEIFLSFIKGEVPCAPDVYEKDVLDSFPRRETLKEEIFAHFIPLIKQGEAPWILPFLILIGYRDVVTDVITTRYNHCHDELTEALGTGKILGKCPESKAYFAAADRFVRNIEPLNPHVHRVLLDMAELCRYSDDPFPPFDFPLHHIVCRLGRKRTCEILDDIRRKHPLGEKLWEHSKKRIDLVDAVPNPNITAAELLSSREHDLENLHLYLSFQQASPAVVREVAQGILTEKDPKRRAHLVMFFCKRHYRGRLLTPPAYPLDPQTLIQLIEAERTNLPETTYQSTPAARIAFVLSSIRHPAVKAYGQSLLSDPQSTPFLRHVGRWMTYGANYQEGDGEKLLIYLKNSPDTGEYWDAVNILIENGERGIPNLPLEALKDVAEQDSYLRHSIVRLLDKAGLLTDEQRRALAFDRSAETRALFARCLE